MLIEQVTVPEGKQGPWTVYRKTIENDVNRMRLVFDGRSPGEPGDVITVLAHQMRGIVMSDTKAERRDHAAFAVAIGRHPGPVLINGLGLGMCLAAALKLGVPHATVVEVDEDVIALTGPHYASDPRVTIVHASAFDYQPPKGARYGAVWHDIWDTISASNLPEMGRLHRKYGRRADWQGSWARWQCESAQRRERSWY